MYKALPIDILWRTTSEKDFIELIELTSDARREAVMSGIVCPQGSRSSAFPLPSHGEVKEVYAFDLVRHSPSYASVRAFFHSTSKEPPNQPQQGEEKTFLASVVLTASEERRLLRFVSSWLHRHQPEKLKEYVQNTISKRVPK